MSRNLSLAALLVSCALLPVPSLAQLSFQPRQVAPVSSNSFLIAHGDFNNDGREDLIVNTYDASSQSYVNELYLSTADGTYDAPKALPALVQAVGDFNHDGNLDVATYASGTSDDLTVYLGNGDGTFRAPQALGPTASGVPFAVDVNHDSKTDIVMFSGGTPAGNPPATIQVWISNGDGTFTKGQSITASIGSLANQTAANAVVGDFDGDGKPDIALIYGYTVSNSEQVPVPTTVQVWFGDGAGHFGSPYVFSDPKHTFDGSLVHVADLNNDGRSDIVAGSSPVSGSETPTMALFFGNANRTLSYKTLTNSACSGANGTGITAADFNGDGLTDLAYETVECGGSKVNTGMEIRLGTGSGNFGPEQLVYQNLYLLTLPYAVRSTLGTRPDIAFEQYNGGSNGSLELLTNDSTGSFPGCGLSGMAEGVQICSPSGASSSSPVKFSVATAGPTPMRTAAVWVDGKKVAEQLPHAFSNYSFLDASVALAAGSHSVTIFGTGWDNTLQEKAFTLNVGSGGSCSAPTSPGVHVCQPASGATVASPVQIQASSTITGKLDRMEVWVDGVKKYTETSGTTLSTTLSLAAGSHRFGVFAVNTAGTKWEQVVYATVK